MIPDNITKEHLEKAIEELDQKGIRKGRHSSTYDLVHKLKSYPPKLVISIANRYANGVELDPSTFEGGKGTPSFQLLSKQGFEVVPKKDPVVKLIKDYKNRIAKTQLKDEEYKWKLLKEYSGRPNVEAKDFYQEIKDSNFDNLVYAMSKAVLNGLAKSKPEELRILFKELFNESVDLTERVNSFNKETLQMYNQIEGKHSHHQDERSIATYLTFHNPEKYTFYKSSFYTAYCKLAGIKKAKKNEKYVHYLTLIDDLIENYIKPDVELISQVQEYLPEYYDGTNHNLLAQDILYQMFDQNEDVKSANFGSVIGKYDKDVLKSYFYYLRKIVFELNIQIHDERVVYSIREDRLNFTIGQRYCFNLFHSNPKRVYGVISTEELVEDSDPFEGNGVQPYYNHFLNFNPDSSEWNSVLDAIRNELSRTSKSGFRKHNNEEFENYVFEEESEENHSSMEYPLNTILYGPPGTGKTYNTVQRAAEIISGREIETYKEALQIFQANLHDRIEFITFHQNYSYEDFIQGLRPDVEEEGTLSFERSDGVFKKLADKALRNLTESENPNQVKRSFEDVFEEFLEPMTEGEVEEVEVNMKKTSYHIIGTSKKSIQFRKASGGTGHTLSINTLAKMYDTEDVFIRTGLHTYYAPLLKVLLKIGQPKNKEGVKVERQNYVIVIDEINRANISRVFGELITLIEPDKRSHGAIPLKAKLPSGDTFMVPSNLYLIGTMNTADKSIALLDIALRRRFEFESMYPKYDIDGAEIYDADILRKINVEIIEGKGHDFQIGHAYFMGDNKDLTKRMNKKVIPLLLEYYMNDEKEVTRILGKAGLMVKDGAWPLEIVVE
jgi:5-methylcytosine-specific restriction protein B